MSHKTNDEYFCSGCGTVLKEGVKVCPKCGVDLLETIEKEVYNKNHGRKFKMHICDYCNEKKEGRLLEWYEVFNATNSNICCKTLDSSPTDYGIYLTGNYFYKCYSCNDIICDECKEKHIRRSIFFGWKNAICPSCSSTFSPPYVNELERGKQEFQNRDSEHTFSKIIRCNKNKSKHIIQCNNCKKEVDPCFNFCNYCGEKIVVPKACEQCKIIIDWDAKFCPQCGSTLAIMEK